MSAKPSTAQYVLWNLRRLANSQAGAKRLDGAIGNSLLNENLEQSLARFLREP